MKTTRYSTKILSAGLGKNSGAFLNSESKIRSCVLIFCLTFVPLNLLLCLTGISSANTAAKVQQPLPPDGAAVTQEPNSSSVHQLLRAEVHVIDANQTAQSQEGRDRLRQVIEQIRSFQLGAEQPQQGTAPSAAPAKAMVIDPDKKEPDSLVRRDDPNNPITSEPSRQRVTNETLQVLKGLLPNPEKLDRPFDVGEVLFSSGNVSDAAAFYQEALRRADANDANASGDRAWILFQIGNCLRNSDRPAASKMYGKLLSEYPQSLWTQMAKTEIKLIDWYLKDTPHTLIGERKPERSAGQ